MSERFIKFIPSDEADYLATKHPKAFILLYFIARRARRILGLPDGLEIGMAKIGDWEICGLTEREYRTAKSILEKRKHIKIIETCRTRKKSTTGTTTIGTLVKLISSSVYDINPETDDDRIDDRATTERRPSDDEQERIRKNKKEKEEQDIAQPAAPLRKKSDSLTFNFDIWQFEGISLQDRKDWEAMYPHVTLDLEIAKASHWLKANPSRNGKKLWRKFLTGWFTRANDSAENKKAFKASASSGLSTDRKTKNQDGTPIKSKAEGFF